MILKVVFGERKESVFTTNVRRCVIKQNSLWKAQFHKKLRYANKSFGGRDSMNYEINPQAPVPPKIADEVVF